MINLILFGPPGSGKGTQAAKLLKKYKLVHISTGDLFRFNLKNKTPLGLEAKKYIDKGDLVPDTVTINMLTEKVNEHPEAKGFIFDGFPRNVDQAKALDKLLKSKGSAVSVLLSLDVDDEELVKRLLNRGKDSGRKDDSDESIIRNRLKVYYNETTPVYDYYEKTGKSIKVNGVGTLLAVFRRLCKIMNKF